MYRINRYIQALRETNTDTHNIVLVDIGSGPGTFTWAVMDWLRETGIARNDVHILAYDYCTAMMPVAVNILLAASHSIVQLERDYDLPPVVHGELNEFNYVVELTTPHGPANVLVELYDDLDAVIAAIRNQKCSRYII